MVVGEGIIQEGFYYSRTCAVSWLTTTVELNRSYSREQKKNLALNFDERKKKTTKFKLKQKY